MTARLNVNIDHVATVRQARRAPEPSVVAAAMLCEQAGADGITIHLSGDRRHIQDRDVMVLRQSVSTYLNLEMAATEEMLKVALEAKTGCSFPGCRKSERDNHRGRSRRSRQYRDRARRREPAAPGGNSCQPLHRS